VSSTASVCGAQIKRGRGRCERFRWSSRNCRVGERGEEWVSERRRARDGIARERAVVRALFLGAGRATLGTLRASELARDGRAAVCRMRECGETWLVQVPSCEIAWDTDKEAMSTSSRASLNSRPMGKWRAQVRARGARWRRTRCGSRRGERQGFRIQQEMKKQAAGDVVSEMEWE